MQKQAEFTGKKVQDAVNEALRALGLTYDDVDIKILSNGGLFKKAKVLISYDDGLPEGAVPAAAAEEKPAAPVPEEKPAPKQKPAKKAENATADEPRWGSAPVKREPTTTSNFGKGAPAEKSESADTVSVQKPRKERKDGEYKPKEQKKKARESVAPTEEQIAVAKEFATELLARMHIAGDVEITADEGMRINVNTEDARVIGHRGEVLDSLQQLVSAVINTEHGKFVHITVDGLGYRDRRKDSLENLARRMAEKAVRTHRKVTLDAMNSADRRIIHAALGNREDVFTRSEGHDPARRVVIIPKRK